MRSRPRKTTDNIQEGTTFTHGTHTQTPPDLATITVTPFLEQAEQIIFVISVQWDLLITIN